MKHRPNRTSNKLIKVYEFKRGWLEDTKTSGLDFEDQNGREINFRNVMNKRQMTMFRVNRKEPLNQKLLSIIEKNNLKFYYLDLNSSYDSSTVNSYQFWSEFAVTFIDKMDLMAGNVSFIIHWNLNEYSEGYEVDHFFEIIETISANTKTFNLIIITETDHLIRMMKGRSILKVMSVHRLSEIPEKDMWRRDLYRNSKLIDKEKLHLTKLEEKELYEKTQREKEKEREKKLKELEELDRKKKIKDFEEYQKRKLIRNKGWSWGDNDSNYNDLVDKNRLRLTESNKNVLLSILNKTKDFKRNEWVPLNEIKNFNDIKDGFEEMMKLNVFDQSGDVVRFKDDIVYEHLSKILVD